MLARAQAGAVCGTRALKSSARARGETNKYTHTHTHEIRERARREHARSIVCKCVCVCSAVCVAASSHTHARARSFTCSRLCVRVRAKYARLQKMVPVVSCERARWKTLYTHTHTRRHSPRMHRQTHIRRNARTARIVSCRAHGLTNKKKRRTHTRV